MDEKTLRYLSDFFDEFARAKRDVQAFGYELGVSQDRNMSLEKQLELMIEGKILKDDKLNEKVKKLKDLFYNVDITTDGAIFREDEHGEEDESFHLYKWFAEVMDEVRNL